LQVSRAARLWPSRINTGIPLTLRGDVAATPLVPRFPRWEFAASDGDQSCRRD